MQEKKSIYFSRTYRHLRINTSRFLAYMLLFVVPVLAVLILSLNKLTHFICNICIKVLAVYFPGVPFNIVTIPFAKLGNINYVDLPTIYPNQNLIMINLIVCLVILVLVTIRKLKSKPLAIYLFINATIQLINCIYFAFATNDFPMRAAVYSKMYIQQQVGIWIAFVVLAGFCTAFVGDREYIYKMLTVLAILAYSIVFGAVRYIVFMFILEQYSFFYTALMYFVVGPLLDFMYFVTIYAFFINKMINKLDSAKERGNWEWS